MSQPLAASIRPGARKGDLQDLRHLARRNFLSRLIQRLEWQLQGTLRALSVGDCQMPGYTGFRLEEITDGADSLQHYIVETFFHGISFVTCYTHEVKDRII